MDILESGMDFESPMMVKVKQTFDATNLDESQIIDSITEQMSKEHIKQLIKPGMKIAIAVGSRGIKHLDVTVKTVVNRLNELGAKPFIVPAMGSHGGATAEGQAEVIDHYGISEETMNVPILSSMETVVLGSVNGIPVHFSKTAIDSDLIIPVCRVKPHTDFKGPIESGIYKMLAIGLGKHKGAATLHRAGFAAFPELIPAIGQYIVEHAPVGFAVATIENSYDDVDSIHIVPGDRISTIEPELLKRARKTLAMININPVDLLIVDQIGKNISGEGMDPNVTGRSPEGISYAGAPDIKRIVVLDLTEETDGNASGLGMADITTRKCFNKINLAPTYANVATAGVFDSAKIPMILDNDKEAIAVGLKAATLLPIEQTRIVRILDTLHLSEFWVSESILPDLENDPNFIITNEKRPFSFDQEGFLTW